MTNVVSDTQVVSILDRRRQLKHQRRLKFWQSTWRTSMAIALAAGLSWAISLPEWRITQSDQVVILGNQQLDTAAILPVIPLSFPSSLLRIKPALIQQSLQENAHIAEATVNRQLFPPRVIIQVQERLPVAMTLCQGCTLATKLPDQQVVKVGPADVWLIDSTGVVLPHDSYQQLQASGQIPALEVQHYLEPASAELQGAADPKAPLLMTVSDQRQQEWQVLFEHLNQSPVAIQSMDWRSPQNLKLQTELGKIHLGPFSSNIAKQLQKLDEMRSLPQSTDLQKIAYINLEKPERPLLELKQPAAKPTTDSSE